jgi:hypothetical protein
VLRKVGQIIHSLMRRSEDCAWARSRISAYASCDPDLSDKEFKLIEQHTVCCEDCARELEHLQEALDVFAEILYPDESMPPLDVEAMASRIMAADESCASSESRSAECFRLPAIRILKPATMLAALVILFIAMPILAYVGPGIYEYVVSGISLDLNMESQATEGPALSMVSPSTSISDICAISQVTCDNAVWDAGCSSGATSVMARIDEEIAILAARAEVEAMLPHTEEEYEAWARGEYPHIMALYDILIGKGLSEERPQQPSLPANWPEMSVGERFAALIPNDSSKNVRDCLLEIAAEAAKHDHPLWDGIPESIPDWGLRLYANTPSEDHPTQWRALLIYSGEIFKHGLSERSNEPIARPSFQGIQYTLPYRGKSAESRITLQFAEQMPSTTNYSRQDATDMTEARESLVFVVASSDIVGTSRFTDLVHLAKRTLVDAEINKSSLCKNEDLFIKQVNEIMNAHTSTIECTIGFTIHISNR